LKKLANSKQLKWNQYQIENGYGDIQVYKKVKSGFNLLKNISLLIYLKYFEKILMNIMGVLVYLNNRLSPINTIGKTALSQKKP
jgi:hypothetical protein